MSFYLTLKTRGLFSWICAWGFLGRTAEQMVLQQPRLLKCKGRFLCFSFTQFFFFICFYWPQLRSKFLQIIAMLPTPAITLQCLQRFKLSSKTHFWESCKFLRKLICFFFFLLLFWKMRFPFAEKVWKYAINLP